MLVAHAMARARERARRLACARAVVQLELKDLSEKFIQKNGCPSCRNILKGAHSSADRSARRTWSVGSYRSPGTLSAPPASGTNAVAQFVTPFSIVRFSR